MTETFITGYIFRYDDDHPTQRVDPGGVMIGKYMTNPIVCNGHNHGIPPIGKMVEMERDDQGMKVKVEITDENFILIHPASTLFLDAGFRSLEWEIKNGITYHQKVEVLEISLCDKKGGWKGV